MKKTFTCAHWGLPVALAVVAWLTGCSTHKLGHQLQKEPAVYATAEQLRTMPACKAVVLERGPCYVRLKTTDGNELLIGSPAAGPDVLQFLEVLEDGRIYKFPDTFQKHQAQTPRRADERLTR